MKIILILLISILAFSCHVGRYNYHEYWGQRKIANAVVAAQWGQTKKAQRKMRKAIRHYEKKARIKRVYLAKHPPKFTIDLSDDTTAVYLIDTANLRKYMLEQ